MMLDAMWIASGNTNKPRGKGEYSVEAARYAWIIKNDELAKKTGEKRFKNQTMFDNLKALDCIASAAVLTFSRGYRGTAGAGTQYRQYPLNLKVLES